MAFLVLAASTTLSTLFLYCIYGKLASESYEKMSNFMYNNLDWQEFPIKLQKYFIIITVNMQQPLYYHGFGLIDLNLTSFVTVTPHC